MQVYFPPFYLQLITKTSHQKSTFPQQNGTILLLQPSPAPSSRLSFVSHGLLGWNLCTPLSHEYHEAPQMNGVVFVELLFFGGEGVNFGQNFNLKEVCDGWKVLKFRHPRQRENLLFCFFSCICARLTISYGYHLFWTNTSTWRTQQPWHICSSCKVPPNFTKSPQA